MLPLKSCLWGGHFISMYSFRDLFRPIMECSLEVTSEGRDLRFERTDLETRFRDGALIRNAAT